jgi:hypothetical protein
MSKSKNTTVVACTAPWLLIMFVVLATLKFGGVLPAIPLWLVFAPLVPLAIILVILLICLGVAGAIFVAALCGLVDSKDFK